MDFFTDMVGGKKSTIVAYPDVSWCSLHTSTGILFSLVSAILLWTADLLAPCLATLPGAAAFLALLRPAARIDGVWQGFYGDWRRWAGYSCRASGGGMHGLHRPRGTIVLKGGGHGICPGPDHREISCTGRHEPEEYPPSTVSGLSYRDEGGRAAALSPDGNSTGDEGWDDDTTRHRDP
ncbi:MAG: hypothetical protein QMC96_03810 [Methanomicrobiales archaeon]|nr:hypothetical protein [Methanomicrobiales archaeon]